MCNYLARNIYVQLSEIIRPYTLFKLLFQVVLQLCFLHEAYRWTSLLGNKCTVFLCYNNISPFFLVSWTKTNFCNDIEVNPGPELDSSKNYTTSHWNLNSIAVHNFSKINLLKTYLTIYKTDIVCLSETYFDCSFPVNDENVVVQCYNLVRYDHPTNSTRRGAFIYYKDRWK